MKLTNFRQFEAAKTLLEKHTIEEIEQQGLLEGMEEFSGMENPIGVLKPLNEFLGLKTWLQNKISAWIPGTGVSEADKLLKEYETLYSQKADEIIKNKRQRYELAMKVKEAENSGSTQLESLRDALKTLEDTQSAKEENNKKKWDAIENRLNIKVADLKKKYKDSERIQSYINLKLANMRVDIYTKLEKDFEKFSNNDEIKAFVKNLEDEKAKFKQLETEITNKTKDIAPEAKPTVGVGNDKKEEDQTEKPEDQTEKKPEDVKKEVSFLDSEETKKTEQPVEQPKAEQPKEPKVGDKFDYTNKKNETHRVIVVGAADGNNIQVQYLDANGKPTGPKIAVLKDKLVPIEKK